MLAIFSLNRSQIMTGWGNFSQTSLRTS